jgi:hypothetical protein
MKATSVLLFCACQFLATATWAGDIKEADYPVQYAVMSSDRADKLLVEKICSMTLHDQANPNVTISVSRNGYGSCHVLATGEVYHGRENQKKNEVELVIPVGAEKARVERWQINGIVSTSPK